MREECIGMKWRRTACELVVPICQNEVVHHVEVEGFPGVLINLCQECLDRLKNQGRVVKEYTRYIIKKGALC